MNQTEIKSTLSNAIEGNAELAALRGDIESGCKAFNEARERGDVKSCASITVTLDEKVDAYATKVRKLVFDTLCGNSDNLLHVILAYDYPVCAYKDEKQDMDIPGGTITVTVRKVDVKRKRIDLQQLDKYSLKHYERRLSSNADCWSMIDELGYFLTRRNCKDLGAKMEKT